MLSTLNLPPGAFAHVKRIFPDYKHDSFFAVIAGIGFAIIGLVPGWEILGALLMLIPIFPALWRLTHNTETLFWEELNEQFIDDFCESYIKAGMRLNLSENECIFDVLSVRSCFFEKDSDGLMICLSALGEKLAVIKKIQEEESEMDNPQTPENNVAEKQQSDESLEFLEARLKEVNKAIVMAERKLDQSNRTPKKKSKKAST